MFANSNRLEYYLRMRTLQIIELNEFKSIHGKLWREILAVESKISYVKILRLLKGERTATDLEIDSLCRTTGKTKEELFPTTNQEKSA